MDHPGLVALGLNPPQQGTELFKLRLGGLFVTEGRVKVGVDAAHGDVAHVVVDIEDLVKLLGSKPVPAHTGVQLQMDLGNGAAAALQPLSATASS